MSRFGLRVALANALVDQELGDILTYTPMRDVVNGEPEVDATRTASAGSVRVILAVPGSLIGVGFGLSTGMHNRATEEPTIFYMASGKLADVRKKDIFAAASGPTFPHKARRYEVADGPQPIGFNRYKVKLFELPLIAGDPV